MEISKRPLGGVSSFFISQVISGGKMKNGKRKRGPSQNYLPHALSRWIIRRPKVVDAPNRRIDNVKTWQSFQTDISGKNETPYGLRPVLMHVLHGGIDAWWHACVTVWWKGRTNLHDAAIVRFSDKGVMVMVSVVSVGTTWKTSARAFCTLLRDHTLTKAKDL